jgi:hypothetical protein
MSESATSSVRSRTSWTDTGPRKRLRAFFVEARPLAQVAARFGYKPTALNVMISRLNAQVRTG